jgi:SAM-dependent methyltransferase
MSLQSRFQSVDSTTDPLYFVRYLDRLSANPEIMRCREMGLEFIAASGVCDVTEIGCGTGDVCAQIAVRYPAFRVLGLDKSKTMLEEGRRRHGSITNLQLREGSFVELLNSRPNIVWIERVLVHCEDPESAFAIAARSLDSNGKLIVIEPDWGTLVVNGLEPRLASLWTSDIANMQLSGTVGRRLPLFFKKHAMTLQRHHIAFLPFKSVAELNNLIDLERTISSAITRRVLSPDDGLELRKQFSQVDAKGELYGFVALIIALGKRLEKNLGTAVCQETRQNCIARTAPSLSYEKS